MIVKSKKSILAYGCYRCEGNATENVSHKTCGFKKNSLVELFSFLMM